MNHKFSEFQWKEHSLEILRIVASEIRKSRLKMIHCKLTNSPAMDRGGVTRNVFGAWFEALPKKMGLQKGIIDWTEQRDI